MAHLVARHNNLFFMSHLKAAIEADSTTYFTKLMVKVLKLVVVTYIYIYKYQKFCYRPTLFTNHAIVKLQICFRQIQKHHTHGKNLNNANLYIM